MFSVRVDRWLFGRVMKVVCELIMIFGVLCRVSDGMLCWII